MNTPPQFHGRWRSFSVSAALETLGKKLQAIRSEDGLTWKEVGRILGKSDDRASDYSNALSEMPVGAFLLGCREWNGRFANAVFAMIGMKLSPIGGDDTSDTAKLEHVLRIAHLISKAISDDVTPGDIDDEELEEFPLADLEAAHTAIAALIDRKVSGGAVRKPRIVK